MNSFRKKNIGSSGITCVKQTFPQFLIDENYHFSKAQDYSKLKISQFKSLGIIDLVISI